MLITLSIMDLVRNLQITRFSAVPQQSKQASKILSHGAHTFKSKALFAPLLMLFNKFRLLKKIKLEAYPML